MEIAIKELLPEYNWNNRNDGLTWEEFLRKWATYWDLWRTHYGGDGGCQIDDSHDSSDNTDPYRNPGPFSKDSLDNTAIRDNNKISPLSNGNQVKIRTSRNGPMRRRLGN